MREHEALIAEARRPEFESEHDEAWGVNGRSPAERSDLVRHLADALEAATAERAEVEADALEALADKYAWASSVRVADIRARAVEIREGRQ